MDVYFEPDLEAFGVFPLEVLRLITRCDDVAPLYSGQFIILMSLCFSSLSRNGFRLV